MSGVQFEIRVIGGNASSTIKGITGDLNDAGKATNSFTDKLGKIATAAFGVNQIRQAISGVTDDFNRAIQPGIDFNSSLTDMQAITGVNSDQLKVLGDNARELAKHFGVDAAGAVEANKLLLSQLSPELAKNSEALNGMTTNAAILSKQLGGDMAGATGILTTAMNQYGVSLDDPIRATAVMTEMMNIMSAGAKEGSAELPQIKEALEQSGMMAKTANVAFNELNASIQVLDKAGKKGAEGGTALRNVMAKLSEGQFMTPQSLNMLKAAGINVDTLSDKSLSFAQRLSALKPIANDMAAMTQLFGTENVTAGIALVNNTATITDLTQKITGTNTATEMADTTMGSFTERMNRINATMKDWGISLFNATSGFVPFINIGMGALSMVANLGGAIQAVSIIGDSKFGAAMSKAGTATMAFARSSGIATLNVLRQAGVMIGSALTSVGSFIVGLVSATAAQWGLNVAISANPIGLLIIGIAAAVGAVAVLISYWDEIKNAIFAFGKWIVDHNPFSWLISLVDSVFPGFKAAMSDLWGWVQEKFDMLFGWISDAWGWITDLFGGDDDDGKATPPTATDKAAVEDFANSVNGKNVMPDINAQGAAMTNSPLANYDPHAKKGKGAKGSSDAASNITSGGTKNNTINLTIHKLQDQTVIHAISAEKGGKQMAEEIIQMILEQVNGMNASLSGM